MCIRDRDMGALKVPQIAKARFAAEPTRPVLTPEDIAALELDAQLTAPPDSTLTEPPLDGEADTEDSVEEGATPMVDNDLLEFVARMNELKAPACRHSKTNRCRVCGIERVPLIDIGPNGETIHPIKWRPIGGTPAVQAVDAGQQAQV